MHYYSLPDRRQRGKRHSGSIEFRHHRLRSLQLLAIMNDDDEEQENIAVPQIFKSNKEEKNQKMYLDQKQVLRERLAVVTVIIKLSHFYISKILDKNDLHQSLFLKQLVPPTDTCGLNQTS